MLHWNRTSLTRVASPNPGARVRILTAVTAPSNRDAWAVGHRRVRPPGRLLTWLGDDLRVTVAYRWRLMLLAR